MPNLINKQGDNTFYNYITPLVRGESFLSTHRINEYLTTAFGANNHATSSEKTHIRFPAPDLETKTGVVTSSADTWRLSVYNGTAFGIGFGQWPVLASGNTNNSSVCNEFGGGPLSASTSYFTFRVSNSYSFIQAAFSNTSLTTLIGFVYAGWLREPSYTGSVYPRGLVGVTGSAANRVTTENETSLTALSTADNSITNPPITCSTSTPGADATDIVIRDNASPNYAIGKLYNCVSLPNSAVVGQLYKNLGVDPEGETNNAWLCVMPWGGRKLAMRVWAEGYV